MTSVGKIYGFDVPNPPDIYGPGAFASSPSAPFVAANVTRHVPTDATARWSSGLFERTDHTVAVRVDKVVTDSVMFHWEATSEMQCDDEGRAYDEEITSGVSSTDSETHSFTQSVGAKGGGEGDGMSFEISGSLSQTDATAHSITIDRTDKTTCHFKCEAHETKQVWQLVATFTHTETLPPIDLGHSIDSWNPVPYPGTQTLTVRTKRSVDRSFHDPRAPG